MSRNDLRSAWLAATNAQRVNAAREDLERLLQPRIQDCESKLTEQKQQNENCAKALLLALDKNLRLSEADAVTELQRLRGENARLRAASAANAAGEADAVSELRRLRGENQALRALAEEGAKHDRDRDECNVKLDHAKHKLRESERSRELLEAECAQLEDDREQLEAACEQLEAENERIAADYKQLAEMFNALHTQQAHDRQAQAVLQMLVGGFGCPAGPGLGLYGPCGPFGF